MSGLGSIEGKDPTDSTKRNSIKVASTGAALVATGAVGQAHNRNINAASSTYASATNTITWVSAVTDVSVQVPATASLSYVLVVYDAPNDAVASAWLADTGGAAVDVAYDLVQAGQTLNRQFSSGISRLDVLPVGAVTRVVVGAV